MSGDTPKAVEEVTEKPTVQNHSGFGRLCLLVFAILVLIALQNNYWHGENGRGAIDALTAELDRQLSMNELQERKNSTLAADIRDLKSGLTATEEHARLNLGLIKSGETFVQVSTAPVIYGNTPRNDDVADAVEVIDPLIADETP